MLNEHLMVKILLRQSPIVELDPTVGRSSP